MTKLDEIVSGNIGGNLPARITNRDNGGHQEQEDPVTEVARFSKAIIALAKPVGIVVGCVTFIVTSYISLLDTAAKVYDQKSELSNYRLGKLEESVKSIHEDNEAIKKYLWDPDTKKKVRK